MVNFPLVTYSRKLCMSFSRSVLLPVSRNRIFPSLCLSIWSLSPAIAVDDPRSVTEKTWQRPFPPRRSLNMQSAFGLLSHSLLGPPWVPLCR